MLRKGPIPRVVHGLLQYVLGAFLVAAPFLFSYHSGAAKAASIVAGLVVLILAATSELPTGLSKVVPLAALLVCEAALVVVFVAAPFVFGFSGEGSPTAVFIVVGIVQLLLMIATRFKPSEDGDGARGRGRRRLLGRRRSSRPTEVAETVEAPPLEVPAERPAAERPADGAGTPPPRA